MNIAIILAGGVGNRVGAGIPKQFIEVLGKPVLVYTVEKFQNHPEIDAIEIVCIKSHISYMQELKDKYGLNKIKWITEGGATFQESVINGIKNLHGKISPDDIVLTHFSASPFVEDPVITDVIKVCKEKGNAISTTPFYLLSTFRDPNESDKAGEWVDRDTLAVMNTPHAFKYSFICDFYKEAFETGAINKVEPHTTSLMQYMGKPIYFSKGSQTNIKITTKEDLDLFEAYVLMKRSKKAENGNS